MTAATVRNMLQELLQYHAGDDDDDDVSEMSEE